MTVLLSANMTRLYRVLDQLDEPEQNDSQVRADLIDEAISLAESDVECARCWAAYR